MVRYSVGEGLRWGEEGKVHNFKNFVKTPESVGSQTAHVFARVHHKSTRTTTVKNPYKSNFIRTHKIISVRLFRFKLRTFYSFICYTVLAIRSF